MSEWQKIGNAPNDTVVLVFVQRNIGEIRTALHSAVYGWMTMPGRYSVTPSHWMPLPAPPRPEGA